MLIPLCRCNNCMTLLEDKNPKTTAHKFELGEKKLPSIVKDGDTWNCPKCGTDRYLSDVGLEVNYHMAVEEEFPILNNLLHWIEKGKKDANKIGATKEHKMLNHFRKQIINELTAK